MSQQRGSLIIVDDNQMNRDALSRRLERKGYAVHVAEDGQRALALISQHPFDLVLLDIEMPVMSGLDVLKVLRTTYAPTQMPIIMVTANRWILSRGLAVRDGSGRPSRIAGSQTDITAGKVIDPLTGLPNRLLFAEHLDRALKRTGRYPDYVFALLFLDLDRFKVVNDSLGPCIGDQLLIAVAQRLQACLRSTDTITHYASGHTVARLEGDAFAILLDDITHARDAARVAERLLRELTLPFLVQGHEVFTSCQMKAWQERFGALAPSLISVNLSSKQLAHPDLVQHIHTMLLDTGLAACCLKLEITESAFMEDLEAAIALLWQLKSTGIR